MFAEKLWIIICLILSSVTLSAAESKTGTATGTFTWKDQTHQIKYAYATQTEDPFDESKKNAFLLLLADAPITQDVSKLDRFSMVRLLEQKNLNGIVVGIDAKNDLFFTDIPRGFSGSGVADFEPGQMKPGFIEGRLHTNGMRKFFDSPYQFDVSFKAAVQSQKVMNAKNGTALPNGGGEPGKAYLVYAKALEAGDLESMMKHKELSSEQIQKMEQVKKESPEQFKQQMAMLSKFTKKNIKVLEGYTNGKEAMLSVEGIDPLSNKSVRGKVEMKQVNGQWMLVDENWDAVKLN
jgi:hypothetical protein